MKHQMFTVIDTLAGTSMRPFFDTSFASAIRSFKEACNDQPHTFCKHPQDFKLMYMGTYDDEEFSFQIETPVTLITAVEAKESDT